MKLIPDAGRYIWDWYFEASDGLSRVRDGVCARIPWTEWEAWRRECGHIVREPERAMLRAMDAAYCVEMNKELAAYQERQAEAAREAAKER